MNNGGAPVSIRESNTGKDFMKTTIRLLALPALILPAILTMADDDALRYGIAAAALLVVIGSVIYSKSQSTSFGDDEATTSA